MVPQQAALLSLRFVPFLAFVPVCSHTSLVSYLRMPHPPAWVPACGVPMGGFGVWRRRGSRGGGFGANKSYRGVGGLAPTRRTEGVWR